MLITLGALAVIGATFGELSLGGALLLAAGPIIGFLLGLFVRTRVTITLVAIAGMLLAGRHPFPPTSTKRWTPRTQRCSQPSWSRSPRCSAWAPGCSCNDSPARPGVASEIQLVGVPPGAYEAEV